MNLTDDVSFEQLFVNYNRSGQRDHGEAFRLGLEVFKRTQYPLVPEWALIVYFTCVNGVGILLNLLLCILYVMKKNKKGIHALILQISVSDILLLTTVSIPELWTHQSGNWTFGSSMCRAYLSFEVFTTTLNIYFMIATCLHSLATANVSEKRPRSSKCSETELLEDMTEMKSSQHSLVSRGGTLTSGKRPRSKKTQDVSVFLPSIFVWVLAAALSVPVFPLSTVIDSRSGVSICTFIEGYHLTSMRLLLVVFQLFVPFVILSGTCGMIVFKLCRMQTNGNDESQSSTRIALFLCSLFLVFSAPRFMMETLHGLWLGNREGAVGLSRYMFPPLNYNITPMSVPLALSFLHFLTPIVKPLAYVYILKRSRKRKQNRNTDNR